MCGASVFVNHSAASGDCKRYVAKAHVNMSMPGFVFFFRCNDCDAHSDHYSMFPLGGHGADVWLPAWSCIHKCWAKIHLRLSPEQRKSLESDADALRAVATSLSSDALTVCVPQLHSGLRVTVTPNSICPKCGQVCDTVPGYPPKEHLLSKAEIPIDEINAASISMIELSVRSRNICLSLGIRTVGQLRKRRNNFVTHKQVADSCVAEIDEWLSIGDSTLESAT